MNASIDVTNVCIETDRMILRPWKESDLLDFYAYASVPGVGEMAGWCHHKSLDEVSPANSLETAEESINNNNSCEDEKSCIFRKRGNNLKENLLTCNEAGCNVNCEENKEYDCADYLKNGAL